MSLARLDDRAHLRTTTLLIQSDAECGNPWARLMAANSNNGACQEPPHTSISNSMPQHNKTRMQEAMRQTTQ
eukprot:4872639-Amphidinium_carterae.1